MHGTEQKDNEKEARAFFLCSSLLQKLQNMWKHCSLFIQQFQKFLSYKHMVRNKKKMKKWPWHFSLALSFLKNFSKCKNTLAYLYHNIKSFHPIKWLYKRIWRKARIIPYGPILPTKHLNKWKHSSLLLAQYQKLLSYRHMVRNEKTTKKKLGHFSFTPANLKSIKMCENTVAYFYHKIKSFYQIDTWYGTKRQWKRG